MKFSLHIYVLTMHCTNNNCYVKPFTFFFDQLLKSLLCLFLKIALAPPVFNPSVISQWIDTCTPCVVTKISETVVSSTILTVSVQLEPEIQTDCSTQTNPVKQPIRARDSLCWPIRGRVEPGNIDDDQDATMMIVSHKRRKAREGWADASMCFPKQDMFCWLLYCFAPNWDISTWW